MNDYVQGNESQVSHAAMWTLELPREAQGDRDAGHLADKWMTIDEVAKKANKFVAGASGNGYIRPSRGFGTAWDKFVNHIEKGLGLKGADIMDKGLSFVAPKKDQPWFLYLGMIDTHVTWRAKQPWMDKYDGGYKGRFENEYGDDGPNGLRRQGPHRQGEGPRPRAVRLATSSYQDDLIGQLVEKLKTWGVWDQTMLIITADHGDEQWEETTASVTARASARRCSTCRCSSTTRRCSRPSQGHRGHREHRHRADARRRARRAERPEWQGASLIPVANGQGGYPLMSFSSQYENWHAGRIGHWKVEADRAPACRSVFDLAKDPDEQQRSLRQARRDRRALVLDPMWMLRQWNVEWKKSQWGNAANVSSRFAADLGE